MAPTDPAARADQGLAAMRRAIRAECARQGIDDDARKSLMERLAGVRSSTQLTRSGASQVLAHLRRAAPAGNRQRSAQAGGEWTFVFQLPADRQRMAQKIYRLAERLGPTQSPPRRVATKAYVEGIARRMCGCLTVLEFCSADLLRNVVQALEIHVRRMGA